MSILFAVLTAAVVAIATIPLMIRLAPMLGMVDLPDPRKVHAIPVPRVGGLGMGLGALVAIVVAVSLSGWVLWYVLGCLVLIVFGALDDSREMGHYTKFVGQLLAVAPLVFAGDVWVSSLPFVAGPLPDWLGKPFTVIAIVGVINALNHSDGLDGLAGGEAVLTLGCIAFLAHIAGGTTLVMLCFAVLGGIFGFLRFNTHPARVFMGDAGSQFLGFSVGTFAVVLTQQVNTSLSMALPALIIGLPIIDILVVFWLRASAGMNWFRATRNHVHHRLLQLGFRHYQAVLLIYGLQTFFVVCALVFRHESDWLVAALYLVPCGLLFALLALGERTGWRARQDSSAARGTHLIARLRYSGALADGLTAGVAVGVAAYLALGGLHVDTAIQGIAPALGIAAVLSLAAVASPQVPWLQVPGRVALYGIVTTWVWLLDRGLGAGMPETVLLESAFFILLALAIAMVWKFGTDTEFAPTTLDFLIAIGVAAAAFLAGGLQDQPRIALLLVKIVLVLYACELVLARGVRWQRGLLGVAATAGVTVALAGALP